jgi:lysylphosphatidylglycerol synthetase-like protein (DUF2156 family)
VPNQAPNLTFYSTAAQVLPILLLAGVIELRALGGVELPRPGWRRRLWLVIAAAVLITIAEAELAALNVLARGYTRPHEQSLVASGLVVALVTLVIGLGRRVAGTDVEKHPDRRALATLLIATVLVVVTIRFAVAPGLFDFFG